MTVKYSGQKTEFPRKVDFGLRTVWKRALRTRKLTLGTQLIHLYYPIITGISPLSI